MEKLKREPSRLGEMVEAGEESNKNLRKELKMLSMAGLKQVAYSEIQNARTTRLTTNVKLLYPIAICMLIEYT